MNNHKISIADLMNEPLESTGGSIGAAKKRAKKLGYIRQQGVTSLSFSRLQTLHSCPRKFLLREVRQRAPELPSIHLAFGSAFGAGVAELFRSRDIKRAYVVALSNWDYDSFDSDYIKNKSFFECTRLLDIFFTNIFPQIDEEWELAYVDGKPAVELLFYIRVSDEYDYQGHIDIVLKHRETSALRVVECKTASKTQVEANWRNSEQALGYYYVLRRMEAMFGVSVAPEILYLTLVVGKWNDPEANWGFQLFPFAMSEYDEPEFLGSLLSDMHLLNLYSENNFFPKRGKACNAFGRVCEHYGVCDFDAIGDVIDADSNAVYEALGIEAADIYIDLTGNHPLEKQNADSGT